MLLLLLVLLLLLLLLVLLLLLLLLVLLLLLLLLDIWTDSGGFSLAGRRRLLWSRQSCGVAQLCIATSAGASIWTGSADDGGFAGRTGALADTLDDLAWRHGAADLFFGHILEHVCWVAGAGDRVGVLVSVGLAVSTQWTFALVADWLVTGRERFARSSLVQAGLCDIVEHIAFDQRRDTGTHIERVAGVVVENGVDNVPHGWLLTVGVRARNSWRSARTVAHHIRRERHLVARSVAENSPVVRTITGSRPLGSAVK